MRTCVRMEKPLEPATYVGFKSALKQEDVAKAFSVARNLSGLLSLLDALELTLLAAEKGEGWEGRFRTARLGGSLERPSRRG